MAANAPTASTGMPGRKASASSASITSSTARGCDSICVATSVASRASVAARVTMRPVPVAITSAGTCVTMPSPTVSSV